jgi:hypothetical protein
MNTPGRTQGLAVGLDTFTRSLVIPSSTWPVAQDPDPGHRYPHREVLL